MRLIKVKMSSDFITWANLPNIFPAIKIVEILEIYQYDRNNFFALEKFTFKPEALLHREDTIRSLFKPMVYQELEQKGNEILVIMKFRMDTGLWPNIFTGFWGLIPPLYIDELHIIATIIIREENIGKIFELIAKAVKSFEILAITEMQSTNENIGQPLPHFTSRQREIANYAQQNGFFESPRRISAEEIADHFQVSISAVNDHLRKVEKIVMKYFFG
jgi:DNA-binding CsgD family transcriptional regulator